VRMAWINLRLKSLVAGSLKKLATDPARRGGNQRVQQRLLRHTIPCRHLTTGRALHHCSRLFLARLSLSFLSVPTVDEGNLSRMLGLDAGCVLARGVARHTGVGMWTVDFFPSGLLGKNEGGIGICGGPVRNMRAGIESGGSECTIQRRGTSIVTVVITVPHQRLLTSAVRECLHSIRACLLCQRKRHFGWSKGIAWGRASVVTMLISAIR
jgi:hypothetical protein